MPMSSRKQVPHLQLCQGTLQHFQVQWAPNPSQVQVGSPTWTWICTWTASRAAFHSIDSPIPSCFAFFGTVEKRSTCKNSSELVGTEAKSKGFVYGSDAEVRSACR